ncbi:BBSome complex member BBS2-like [Onthophagus taurus]|uniref:BBSome complex member BBS2-like n=1 Tax=Onthophagus taurus TaxID=166361 RepID=UPI0039BE30E9
MEKQIRPVFTLDLNYKIIPGLVTIGKYDGTHPCITAATTADKILIHSPHRKTSTITGRIIWSETNREIATLNINQKITCIESGQFLPNDDKDILIIGTQMHILVYHVHDNKDIFYKECVDGVKAVTLGTLRDAKTNLILIGGNSTVKGLNHEGEEIFWTAIGDVITSLVLMDYNKDGINELIVSSEDFKIRVYKGDQLISEQTETEVVTGVESVSENKFAYSISNGTIGVYEQDVRLWRVKSKNFAISIHTYDLLGKGNSQLITGWSNGKIDCRSILTGEVLFKDNMDHGIAGIVEGDYRSVGKNDLICVTVEGEVRGYTTNKSILINNTQEHDIVRELLSQKQALLQELKHYENNTKNSNNLEQLGGIPANTRLQISITASNENENKNSVEIFISTNNSTIIKAVIVFAEGIFEGETHVVHPSNSKLKSCLIVPLKPPRDTLVDIHMKILVGYPKSTQYNVFEITRQLPRFSMYSKIDNPKHKPESYVTFQINERLQRICMWLNQNFLLTNEIEFNNEANLKVFLLCLRDDSELWMDFSSSGKVWIYTDNLGLASDLIQSLATFLNLDTLEVNACFVKEENNLKDLVEKLNKIQETRIKLGADIADRLTLIRELIIRAEDSRINCLDDVPKYYNELNNINQELINGYNIRLSNYNEGVETMKMINGIIQKSSRLRVGKKSSEMVNACRLAIKSNNTEGLIKIIKTGIL